MSSYWATARECPGRRRAFLLLIKSGTQQAYSIYVYAEKIPLLSACYGYPVWSGTLLIRPGEFARDPDSVFFCPVSGCTAQSAHGQVSDLGDTEGAGYCALADH